MIPNWSFRFHPKMTVGDHCWGGYRRWKGQFECQICCQNWLLFGLTRIRDILPHQVSLVSAVPVCLVTAVPVCLVQFAWSSLQLMPKSLPGPACSLCRRVCLVDFVGISRKVCLVVCLVRFGNQPGRKLIRNRHMYIYIYVCVCFVIGLGFVLPAPV